MYLNASQNCCHVCHSSTDNTNLATLTACHATACARLSASKELAGAVASMRFLTMPCKTALQLSYKNTAQGGQVTPRAWSLCGHIDTKALHMLYQCHAASQSCDACLELLWEIGSPGLFA